MSGGDLDGDTYMVIWDQEIVAGMTEEPEPAPVSKKNDRNQIQSNDLVTNLLHYHTHD